jgi:hypothetical protein
MSQPGTKLSKQTLIFDEVVWHDDPVSINDWRNGIGKKNIQGKPSGLRSGMKNDVAQPPYWEFDYETNNISGLILSNIVVRDSQNAGSTETVFESISFANVEVGFSSGNVPFNFARAFLNPQSTFQFRQNGSRQVGTAPVDPLFQYGLKMTLKDNVLVAPAYCEVVVELSVVFRGAKNDVDPGGIPVGMKVWPQVACTWNNFPISTILPTARVTSFQGNIKIAANNKMFPHAGGHVMNENIASFFTDSNTSMKGNQRGNILTGRPFRNTAGVILGAPSGWGLVFDYTKLHVKQETEEFVVITNPPVYARPLTTYIWPDPSDITSTTMSSAALDLEKDNRQMRYDNIHIHAAMHNNDPFGNTQIHAPFCGHSCLHSHWRWSSISSNGATGGRGWQFKGWSTGLNAQANSSDNAPLVPPNQIIYVALTKPNANMFSPSQIINTAAPQNLDLSTKLFWYRFIVSKPDANEKQVVMDHGLGWAYRYCTPSENKIIGDLYNLIHPVVAVLLLLPQVVTVLPSTQQEVSDFFELEVYPFFRYIGGGVRNHSNQPINQVPPGSYSKVFASPGASTMEGL